MEYLQVLLNALDVFLILVFGFLTESQHALENYFNFSNRMYLGLMGHLLEYGMKWLKLAFPELPSVFWSKSGSLLTRVPHCARL